MYYFPKHVKNRPVSWAQYMREFVQALWNWKNLEKPLYFCPFWMPTTWEVSLARKYFLQNALTKPRFFRDRWRGIVPLHVPWQVHNHSSVTFSPTRAGRPCAMTILCERQPRAFNAGLLPARRRRQGRTMILLERAGRKRRGGTPMDPIRCRAPDESRAHGGEAK